MHHSVGVLDLLNSQQYESLSPSVPIVSSQWSEDPSQTEHTPEDISAPKTKLLLSKAAQNALPVGENLLHRQVNDSVKCPYCDQDESVLHLLFKCPFAAKTWQLAPTTTTLSPLAIIDVKDGIRLANSLLCLPPTGLNAGPISPWIIWTIWTARNKLIFNKQKTSPEEAILLALVRAKEWQSAQSTLEKICSPTQPLIKPPIPMNALTCFTDAAWKDDGCAGLGWVFMNSQEQVSCEGSSCVLSVSSPLMAEAMATLAALCVAVESDLKTIQFASDSQMLVNALNGKLSSKELHGILYDILELSANLSFVSYSFIPRNFNRHADALAKEALNGLIIVT
ncbi:PREDICTED: uncharacterized protein LOC104753549 [Camelina sativa]|uniref:Uncharacterized protein LOC104753549 n=1 Tax=Camelina sativa TaxID=90675 RepID=A0ABM1R2P9_CAMSA|nr:PREDICTED: uncharacterized protein LOC104753549 [Camelina sativa]